METINAVPNITQMISSKTHVYIAGWGDIQIITGGVRGVVDPTFHVARDSIFLRPVGVLYRNDLDEYLMNILDEV